MRRILTKKFELGLFEHPFTDRTHLGEVGSAAAPRPGPRGRRRVAGAAEEQGQGCCRCRARERVYVAGGNADDIGNQAGGWTVAWQGLSGDIIPGNTILEGIRQVAPDARVTYSEDASAPTAGNDVGVVVVGETPYAEGFGDVGGPQWQDDGVPREPKTMRLSDADRAAVDRVCGVDRRAWCWSSPAGRRSSTDQLAKIDALVASWLPGSAGRRRRRRPVRRPAVHRQAVA